MAALMYVFWVVLNGRITWEIAWIGVAVTALAMLFLCACCEWSVKKEMGLYRCVPRMIAYAGVMLWEILKANLALAKVVYHEKPEPIVRTVHTRLKTRLGRMILANSITLTPGTITLSLKEDEIKIHCLTPEMAEGLDHTVFEKRLEKIEEALHG